MNLFNTTMLVYQELKRQTTLNRNWVWKQTISKHTKKPITKDIRLIVQFVRWIEKKYPTQKNMDFIVRYFEFQFARYEGIHTTRHGEDNGVNSIMIQWLIGEKARHKWETRDLKQNVYVKYRIKRTVHLKLRNAFAEETAKQKTIEIEKMYGEMPIYENSFKKQFYNTLTGLVNCWQNTTLHHPASELCKACNNAEQCRILQQKHYPIIYKIRNNG